MPEDSCFCFLFFLVSSIKVSEYPFNQNKNMLKKHESAVVYVFYYYIFYPSMH